MARPVVRNRASGTSAAGAVTLNARAGVITTESVSTAAGSDYAFTLTNSFIGPDSVVLVNVYNGTNTTAYPVVYSIAPASGSVVLKVRNAHATVALNGTLKIGFLVF